MLRHFTAGASLPVSRMCSSFGPILPRMSDSKILVASPVANVQDQAPDEVGGEAADQDHDQHGQVPATVLAVPCWMVMRLDRIPAASP